MPMAFALVHQVNQALIEAKQNATRRQEIREALRSPASLLDAAERLQLLRPLDTQATGDARLLFTALPPALEAALVSAFASALERDLHATFAWKPGHDFELRIWEATSGGVGGMTILLVSPMPRELRGRTGTPPDVPNSPAP